MPRYPQLNLGSPQSNLVQAAAFRRLEEQVLEIGGYVETKVPWCRLWDFQWDCSCSLEFDGICEILMEFNRIVMGLFSGF